MGRACRRWAEPPKRVRVVHGRRRGRPVWKRPDPRDSWDQRALEQGRYEERWEGRLCGGTLRQLYVRQIVNGAARGWQSIGTVCLRCHHVALDAAALPPDTGWSAQRVRVPVAPDQDEPPAEVPWPLRECGGERHVYGAVWTSS